MSTAAARTAGPSPCLSVLSALCVLSFVGHWWVASTWRPPDAAAAACTVHVAAPATGARLDNPAKEAPPAQQAPARAATRGSSTSAHNGGALPCPADRVVTWRTSNYSKFIDNVVAAVNTVTVGTKPLVWVYANWPVTGGSPAAPAGGLLLEFGVFRGESLRWLKGVKKNYSHAGPAAGFDSFRGLPDAWRTDFAAGAFKTPGNEVQRIVADVSPEVTLEVGWFQDTLPRYLDAVDEAARLDTLSSARSSAGPSSRPVPATLVHLDGDLFVSMVIPMQLLADRIRPGTVLVLDDLYQFEDFEKHEMLALFLWMRQTRATLCALATHSAVSRDPRRWGETRRLHKKVKEAPPDRQSGAFQVIRVEAQET